MNDSEFPNDVLYKRHKLSEELQGLRDGIVALDLTIIKLQRMYNYWEQGTNIQYQVQTMQPHLNSLDRQIADLRQKGL